MGQFKFIENMIEGKLLSLHTAYLAKVLSVNGSKAKIQPLGMTKAYGETAKKQSPLSSVPILSSARYKATLKGGELADVKPIASGDIVLCVCCERDITEAKKGKNATPALGHHSMSDSIIVGVL